MLLQLLLFSSWALAGPAPNSDGSCYAYRVKSGDSCWSIAQANGVTVDDIGNSWNRYTWGWTGCDGLQTDQNICISGGYSPPMPAPITNAICGPQVPGTSKPSNMSTLPELNPCPLKACCDKWGQCGTTAEFCTITQSSTGNPGTSAPGTNGCISNCGTDIVNNANAPATYRRVGYFEAWNVKERSCLTMDIIGIDKTQYDTIHFAFAGITSDFQVDVSAVQEQWNRFEYLGGVKRVLSFGGWSFSTSADTSPIFRSAVTDANKKAFINNLVNFANQWNIDGYDFDWEYPGATDIKGAAPGDPGDGCLELMGGEIVRSEASTSGVSILQRPIPGVCYTSGAQPGNCTKAAGYISNVELEDLKRSAPSFTSTYDASSDSVILTWGKDQWASYMDNTVRQGRQNLYQALNFGGWAEWAVDLNLNTSSHGDVYVGNDTVGGFTQKSRVDGSKLSYPSYSSIISPYMRVPAPEPYCFFYVVDDTVLNRDGIINLAKSYQGITLYDVSYPDDDPRAPFNLKGGIARQYDDYKQLRGWFRVTSAAYARVCKGRAYLIWDGVNPFSNSNTGWVSIWASDEFPSIYDGYSEIDTIYTINPRDPSNPKLAWSRLQSAPDGWINRQPLIKRGIQEPFQFNATELNVTEVIYTDGTDLEGMNTAKNVFRRSPLTRGIEQDPEGTAYTRGQTNGWVPGRCSFHFKQWMLGGSKLLLDITLFDHDQTNTVGGLKTQGLTYGSSFAITSRLPWTLVVRTGQSANDPIKFSYAGFDFSSDGGVCSTGAYDGKIPSRKREGDCSFACSVTQ